MKRTMKKAMSILAASAVLALTLAGCGNESTDPATTDGSGTDSASTVSGTVATNGSTSMEKVIGNLKEQFENDNDGNVTVSYDATGSGAGIEAVVNGTADIGLSSRALKEEETSSGLKGTTIALDGIAVIVNADSQVADLTVDQIAKIFTGEITNWSQVGGEDRDIIPFQRNPEAGSQALMKKLVMDGLEMMEPPVDYTAGSMSSLLEGVRQYDNSPAAIGYTVYYYAHDMEMAQGLKLLSIDGTAPSPDTIRSGEYPFLNPYYAVMDKDEAEDSPARILYDWLLGEEGQSLMAQEGYVSILEQEG